LCATNDGFVIADKDLQLRGPGDIEGTRQSGALDFKLASLLQDKELVQTARKWAEKLLAEDPDLQGAPQEPLRRFLQSQRGKTAWSLIS
jgi:ATP-dependent DNA helicase RecG